MNESERVLARIQHDRGAISGIFKLLASYDPRFLEAFHETHLHVTHESHQLDRKTKEFAIIAANAATYFAPGLRIHFREALRLGVTPAELVELLETVSLGCGMHVIVAALPILDEVLKEP